MMFGLFNLFGNAPVFCGVRHADLDLGGVGTTAIPVSSVEMERTSSLTDGFGFDSADSFDRVGSCSIDFGM